MSDSRERFLDLALGEALGALEPPDLTEQVLLVIRDERRPGARTGLRSRTLRVAVAASLLLVALGGLWALLRGKQEPGFVVPSPVARSAEPMRILNAKGVSREGDRLEPGEAAFVAGPGEGRLTFWNGAELALAPESLVELSARDGQAVARLLEGRMRLRNPTSSAFLVETSAGRVVVDPGGIVDVEATPIPPPPPGDAFERMAARVRGEVEPALPIRVAVASESVVTAGPGAPTRATSGDLLCLSPGVPATRVRVPDPATRSEMDGRIADILVSTLGADFRRDVAAQEHAKKAAQAMTVLRRHVQENDRGGGYVAAVLSHLSATPAPRDVRARVLELLVRDPELRGRVALARSVRSEPEAFQADTLVAVAERGIDGAEARLRARLRESIPARQRIQISAFFALRGDAEGRDTLVDAAGQLNVEPMNVLDRLAAATGLHRLGMREPWKETVRAVRDKVEGLLEAGNLGDARAYVLDVAYFHRALPKAGTVDLAFLSEKVKQYAEGRSAELGTPAQVRTLLAAMEEE